MIWNTVRKKFEQRDFSKSLQFFESEFVLVSTRACCFLRQMQVPMNAMMMMTMTMTMIQTAERNTSLGSDGTQRRTAGSQTTELKVLIQNDTTAETSHVRTTIILVQATENKGYFPAKIKMVKTYSYPSIVITNWQH